MLDALKPTLAPLVLRLGLATIFISYGYLKIAVAGGDHWYNPTVLSPTVQLLVAWAELIGGIALALGLLTRVAALGIGVIMLGAIATVMGPRDFLVIGRQIDSSPGGTGFDFTRVGFEYNAAIMTMCLTLMILGGGRLSLDHLIFCRRKTAPSARPLEPVSAGKTA